MQLPLNQELNIIQGSEVTKGLVLEQNKNLASFCRTLNQRQGPHHLPSVAASQCPTQTSSRGPQRSRATGKSTLQGSPSPASGIADTRSLQETQSSHVRRLLGESKWDETQTRILVQRREFESQVRPPPATEIFTH